MWGKSSGGSLSSDCLHWWEIRLQHCELFIRMGGFRCPKKDSASREEEKIPAWEGVGLGKLGYQAVQVDVGCGKGGGGPSGR